MHTDSTAADCMGPFQCSPLNLKERHALAFHERARHLIEFNYFWRSSLTASYYYYYTSRCECLQYSTSSINSRPPQLRRKRGKFPQNKRTATMYWYLIICRTIGIPGIDPLAWLLALTLLYPPLASHQRWELSPLRTLFMS